jgi:hypothetical protein
MARYYSNVDVTCSRNMFRAYTTTYHGSHWPRLLLWFAVLFVLTGASAVV